MRPRLTLVTLGVTDLPRARRFYCEGLGWDASSAGNESVVFIAAGGVVLALWDRACLAEDAGLAAAGTGFGGIALAHNVGSDAEVDDALAVAVKAGGRLLKAAHRTSWGGYSGYFADLDGHPWEVAHNPFWQLDDGVLVLPA